MILNNREGRCPLTGCFMQREQGALPRSPTACVRHPALLWVLVDVFCQLTEKPWWLLRPCVRAQIFGHCQLPRGTGTKSLWLQVLQVPVLSPEPFTPWLRAFSRHLAREVSVSLLHSPQTARSALHSCVTLILSTSTSTALERSGLSVSHTVLAGAIASGWKWCLVS